MSNFDFSQISNLYALIAFILAVFLNFLQSFINKIKIKKTNKKIEDIARIDKQDIIIAELKKQIQEIAKNVTEIKDFMSRDKRASNFNLRLINFYNDFLNKNILDEDYKIIYQYAISQAYELYKELISSDLENLSDEIFYLMLKNKIINIYEKFKSVVDIDENRIDEQLENIERAKQLIYSEMDIVTDKFKIAKKTKKNGELMSELADILCRFTNRIFYKTYQLLI